MVGSKCSESTRLAAREPLGTARVARPLHITSRNIALIKALFKSGEGVDRGCRHSRCCRYQRVYVRRLSCCLRGQQKDPVAAAHQSRHLLILHLTHCFFRSSIDVYSCAVQSAVW